MEGQIPGSAEELLRWLTGEVSPCWVRLVADASRPGYAEYLGSDGSPEARQHQASLVTARLIYAFSHLYLLGASEGALEAANHGFDFLSRFCRDASDGGCWSAVSAVGEPVEAWKDCYDQSFVLLAMAFFYRATGRKEALDLADGVMECLAFKLRDAERGGYAERFPLPEGAAIMRRQNPHMHLLEAFHALFEATSETRWRDHAAEIVDLFHTNFYDGKTGTLREFFAEDWSPAPGLPGQIREPGHHFEWAWLLHRHGRLFGDTSIIEPARRLFDFAANAGTDHETGFFPAAFDEIDAAGAVIKSSKLFWPQSEALKAFLVRAEQEGDMESAIAARERLHLLFHHYIVDRGGRWRNQLNRNGADIAAKLPVRVFYHFVSAMAECVRVWSVLESRSDSAPLRRIS